MKVLVIGSGGREHALGWKLNESSKIEKLYFAPGNGGTALIGENVLIDVLNFTKIINFAKNKKIDLVVVGPDDPLAAGLVDKLKDNGIKAFGPTKKAAKIESSKLFAKELMSKQYIPTAHYKSFKDYKKAKSYIKKIKLPIVIKADGLALGKGVYICKTEAEANSALKKIMVERVFGSAGETVVVEEFLIGEEASLHALSDGVSYTMFPVSQDHKQIGEGDTGPNTGGVGSFAPVPWTNPKFLRKSGEIIVEPILKELNKIGTPFMGCLYPGVIKTKKHTKVIEYNCRFGDPETQVYMRLLESDLLETLSACIEKRLKDTKLKWRKTYAACVVLCSGGYPGRYKTGYTIEGIEEAEKVQNVVIFHAGTTIKNDKHLTSGGRVLNITATGDSLNQALSNVYKAAKKIKFKDMYYRKDIGHRVLS